jgi:predicted TIM-barrel fold metal-dependent hydrolase
MTGLNDCIDVHSHAISDIGQGPPLDLLPEWSVERTLSLMDEHGIAACIISVPDAANHAEGRKACEIARRINEFLAEIVVRHPSRFGVIATLPGRNIDGTLVEMAYALDILKMDGVATSTSINDVYLGEAIFDPWFDEMNRRAVSLFIHPTIARASRPLDLGLNVAILEFMFDTTRMLTNMVLSGNKKRFSNIKMISAHAGGTVPFLVSRIQILETHFGPGRERAPLSAEEIQESLASFYYDLTCSTSIAQLGALLELVPVSQLLMGFDIPFMPSWSIAPAIADIECFSRLDENDRRILSYDNASRLYPGLRSRIRNSQPAALTG